MRAASRGRGWARRRAGKLVVQTAEKAGEFPKQIPEMSESELGVRSGRRLAHQPELVFEIVDEGAERGAESVAGLFVKPFGFRQLPCCPGKKHEPAPAAGC
jgi:hypothetical protein